MSNKTILQMALVTVGTMFVLSMIQRQVPAVRDALSGQTDLVGPRGPSGGFFSQDLPLVA